MPMPLCHILRARLRQQGKGDKSTLPVRDNSKWSLQRVLHERVLWHRQKIGQEPHPDKARRDM